VFLDVVSRRRAFVVLGSPPTVTPRSLTAAPQVSEDLQQTGAGDFVMLTAWAVQQDIMLEPDRAADPQNTTLARLFSEAIARGASSWSLLWRNVVPPGDGDISNFERATAFKEMIAAANERVPGGSSRAIIDGRTPLPSGSHHQKTVRSLAPSARALAS